jgi:hypothetical protein
MTTTMWTSPPRSAPILGLAQRIFCRALGR